jgi:hypothetical protein
MMQACDKQKLKTKIHHLLFGFIFNTNDNNENKKIRNATPGREIHYTRKSFANSCFTLGVAMISS